VDAPVLVATGVIVADFGIVSLIKEFAALYKYGDEAKTAFKTNELVVAVLAEATAPAKKGQ